MKDYKLEIKDLVTQIHGKVLHDHLNLTVNTGEIIGIVGGSGSGKSVLLRAILDLTVIHQGTIKMFGVNTRHKQQMRPLYKKCAVLFQSGALFSSLTVAENIQMPMRELAGLQDKLSYPLALSKLSLVGLHQDVANRYPAELSGGMIKRVALARALAIDAELIFLDEPTAGLDPVSAQEFDELLKTLQKLLKLTVVMVTHDLDSLHAVCNRVAVLVDKKVIVGTISELLKNPHPWIQEYFQGPRGRAIVQH